MRVERMRERIRERIREKRREGTARAGVSFLGDFYIREKKERKKSMFSIECRRTGRGPIVTRGVNVCGKNECFYCHTNYISH